VDICASNFWETEERRSLSTFTTALTNDNFEIVSLPEDPEAMEEKFDFWALFTPILAPFQPETWALIVGNFVLAGLCLCRCLCLCLCLRDTAGLTMARAQVS